MLDFEDLREDRKAQGVLDVDLPGAVQVVVVESSVRIVKPRRRDETIVSDVAAADEPGSTFVLDERAIFLRKANSEKTKRDLNVLLKTEIFNKKSDFYLKLTFILMRFSV